MMKYRMSAKKIRDALTKGENVEIKHESGVYRWWFPKTKAKEILAKFKNSVQYEGRILQEQNIEGVTYIALYFGISSDLRRRIRWHIQGPFKCSTLRRTLRSIITPGNNDKYAEEHVNNLIDSCYWEWEYTNDRKTAREMEKKELSSVQFSYPLNIGDNETMSEDWIAELKQKRFDNKMNV